MQGGQHQWEEDNVNGEGGQEGAKEEGKDDREEGKDDGEEGDDEREDSDDREPGGRSRCIRQTQLGRTRLCPTRLWQMQLGWTQLSQKFSQMQLDGCG